MTDALLWLAVGAPLIVGSVAVLGGGRRTIAAAVFGAAAIGLAAATATVISPGGETTWLVADRVGGIYLGTITLVCAASALVSSTYLAGQPGAFFSPRLSARLYWLLLSVFWTALALLTVIANLGLGWLVVEASTAASAVLVAHSGRSRALEAGWKYLMLTTLGLSAAFLGIVVLLLSEGRDAGLHSLDWPAAGRTLATMPHQAALTVFALVMVGLAAKIGWAPIHNWLPDAHSEAPAPISAMLSAALLPTVMLLAWRFRDAAIPALGRETADLPLFAFGLCSVALAVPFLWQPMAWKRLLAYSSLEHMGILAVGIGFGGPLALTGVVIHVVGHALAKSTGFFAAIPLIAAEPEAARHRASAVVDRAPATATAMAVSAGTLAGLPPGPLFFSEVLIILGGFQTGHALIAIVLAVLVGMAFLGMLAALLAIVRAGPAGDRDQVAEATRPILAATIAVTALLLAVSVSAWVVSGHGPLGDLARGIT